MGRSARGDGNGHDADGTPWGERDAEGRRAMLTGILAQVSSEALQGDTLVLSLSSGDVTLSRV